MEERRGEQYIKEVTSGILDIKREDKGIGKGRPTEVPSNHNIHNNNNSQPCLLNQEIKMADSYPAILQQQQQQRPLLLLLLTLL